VALGLAATGVEVLAFNGFFVVVAFFCGRGFGLAAAGFFGSWFGILIVE